MQTASNNGYGPNKRDANAAKRAILAIQLRTKKLTYDEIAKACGYSNASAARNAIQRELDREISANVEQYRKEELAILDAMQTEIWPMFIDKNNKGRLFAADRILAISERRSKLLGLDQTPDQAAIANTIIIREVPQGLLDTTITAEIAEKVI